MKNKWSSLLVKSNISDFLIEEVISHTNKSIDGLRITVQNKKDIKVLKQAVKDISVDLPKELTKELKDEISEITQDHTWKKSSRGQYILELNDWRQSFDSELKNLGKFEGLFVGGHSEREVVYITGKLKENEKIEDFLAFIQNQKPPRKIEIKIIN